MPTLNDLAQEGARIRLEELRAEMNTLYRMFPRLKFVKKAAPVLTNVAKVAAPMVGRASGTGRPAGRRKWTAAQRKAAADRMRKYWAKRKRNGTTT